MTSLTATTLNIQNRGLLKKGYYADITIFNSNTIIDNATFDDPHQFATGVQYVVVNGELVVSEGIHTGRRPGKVLRGPGYSSNQKLY